MQPLVLDPVADPRWHALTQARDATIFHHHEWLGILRDVYGFGLWACCLEGPDGELAAGLPVATVRSRLTGHRLVAVPFSDLCAPVVGGDASRLAPLMAAVEEERRRRGLPLEIHADVADLPGASHGEAFFHQTMALPDDPDDLPGLLRPAKRRDVRRAQREGVVSERRTDGEALDIFYALHARTRRKLGVPTQPRRFIRAFDRLFAAGLGFVLIARHEQRPIAASVFLQCNGVTTLKYNASDERTLKLRANQLLYFEALRIAVESGSRRFDFGRTELDNDGLRTFKAEFGAEASTLRYTRLPAQPPGRTVRSMNRLQRRAIQRAPTAVSRLAGAVLYRHFA